MRRRFFLDQRPQAVHVLLRLEQVGLCLFEIGIGLQQGYLMLRKLMIRLALFEVSFGLGNIRFVRTPVERVQHLPRLDVGPGLEQPLLDVAIHAPAHLDHVARIGLGRVLAIEGGVFRLHLDHRDKGSRRRPRRADHAAGSLATCRGQAQQHCAHHQKTAH